MSVNHPAMTHLPTKSYAVTKLQTYLLRASLHCTPVLLGWNPMKANAIQIHFWLETFCFRAFLLKTGHFLIYLFILTSLFLYLVHVYIVSRIAQKRNNIKCIIFVVLNWLLFICLTLPVTSATADKEQHPKPSSSQYSQIVCDSNIIDWDIYLYSQHCESQIKWLEEQNNAAGYI